MLNSRQSGHARGSHERGITLLEVLFALSILTASLVALSSLYANAIRLSKLNEERAIARVQLQSLIDQAGASLPFSEAPHTGTFDNAASWRMEITPVRRGRRNKGLTAYRIDTTVTWRQAPRARSLSVSTVKLGYDEKRNVNRPPGDPSPSNDERTDNAKVITR